MIYETAFVVRPDASEDVLSSIKNMIQETLKEFKAETLVNDAWGMKTFAQPMQNGLKKGNYFYVMYKGDGRVNAELERKFGINEHIARFLICKLGEDKNQDTIVKQYKNPNHSNFQAGDDEEFSEEKERKMHSKRRSCWFSAKKTSPDWKDPKTYSWLVNEFGKISAQRVTGLTPKFQRKATDAIKRGRMMGMISYMSNETFR